MSDDWTLSASKLKTFDECAEAFRLQYLEGHRDLGYETRWIRLGNAVHEAIEDVLEPGMEPRDQDLIAIRFKTAYRDNGGPDGYELTDDEHRDVLGCFDVAARFIAQMEPEIVSIEEEFEFGVDRATITRDFGGFIDVVARTDDGLEVWDWKTGKSKDKGLQERLQGMLYAMGVAQEYGEVPVAVRFAYLHEGKGDNHPKQRSFEPSDDAYDTVIGRARMVLQAIEEDEFPATPGPSKCHFCDVEPFCTASSVGVGNVSYSDYP